jgi:hypothetical protein
MEDQIQKLRQAQELMREAAGLLQEVTWDLNKQEGMSTTSQRLRGYIIGHLEPLIDSEHGWMGKSLNLENIIEEIEYLGEEPEEEE